MSHSPLVSVLVPIYNVEKYLRECLESLAAQTIQDAEFLCINDGSTDSSPEIIAEFMQLDKRFRLIDKANSGYGASMNQGLAQAQGKYIAILESDDYMIPNGLELLVEKLEQTDADFVKANFYLTWTEATNRDEFFEVIPATVAGAIVDPKDHPELFFSKPSIWSAAYKRAFLESEKINFLETPGASFQDTSFTFKVYAQAQKAAFLNTALVHYRQDNENSSVNSPGKVDAVFTEYAEISRWIDSHPDPRLHPIKTKMFFDVSIWNYNRVAPEHKLEVLTRAATQLREEQRQGHLDICLFDPQALLGLRSLLTDVKNFDREHAQSSTLSGRILRVLRTEGPLNLAVKAAKKSARVLRNKLR